MGQMNWRRGLTRLHVVLWAMWAVGTGVAAGIEAYQMLPSPATVSDLAIGITRVLILWVLVALLIPAALGLAVRWVWDHLQGAR